MKYQCPACRYGNEITVNKKSTAERFRCDFCQEEFFYIDGVFFILTAEEDFYNLKRKLERFVEHTNAKN